MSEVPHTERPIFFTYVQRGDHYDYDDSNQTAAERRPISPFEAWINVADVPASAPALAPWPGGPIVGSVRGVSGVPLGPVPGNAFRFSYQYSSPPPAPPFDHFLDMVPANYSNNAFTPALRDSASRLVPYDPSVWVADGLLGLVEFKYKKPQALGFTPPFTIDYWRYVGSFAGSGVLANDGAGAQVYEAGSVDPSLLRTLVADSTPANRGVAVTQGASTIVIGNTMTGANLEPAGVTTSQVFAQKNAGSGNLEFRALDAGLNVTLVQTATGITINAAPGGAGISGLSNEGGGAGVFDTIMGTTAVLRSLVGTANGLSVTQNPTTITIDNTLTGANLGAGTGTLFSAKSGANLQFNSLAGTANGLTVSTPAAGVITIDNTLTGANVGAGAALFRDKTTNSLNFRSLLAAIGSGVALTQNANDVTISAAAGAVVTVANEGAGTGQVFDAVVSNQANLRTLQADPLAANAGIAVATAGSVINIGNTLTGANVGAGTGLLFSAKSGANLQFNGLAGTANGLTVSAPVANVITIDNTLTGANIGGGTGLLFGSKSGASLQFNSLAGTTNGLSVSAPVAGLITIDNTLTGANVGAGTGLLFSSKSGASLQFNSLAGTANGLTVSAPAANVITIDNTLTGSNVGAGSGLFRDKTANSLNFRSLIAAATSGLTLTQNANDVTLDAAVGSVVAIANEGAGPGQVFDAVVANQANLRTLQADPLAANAGIAVATSGSVINIGNTLTGANVGAGTGTLFSAKSGANLQFNTLAGTANGLTVSAPAANVITIDNTLTGSNLGGGTGLLFSSKSGANLQFNSLAGTANGLTVSAPVAGLITVDNTLTGANVGAGTGTLFSAKSGASLQFNSLAGTANGLTVSVPVANVITIDNTLTGANVGAGAGTLFSAKSGASLQFNSLAGTANGLTVSAPAANVITIDNTLTGANVGAGTGTLFSAKSGANLQFNSLAGTANGLTVSAPVANVVTIDNTLTGANVGGGTGTLFSAKSGASLQFNTLAAGTNISVSAPASNVVTIAESGAAIAQANRADALSSSQMPPAVRDVWSVATGTSSTAMISQAYIPSIKRIVGGGSGIGNGAWYSDDGGATWTQATTVIAASLAVGYSSDLDLVVARPSSGTAVYTSSDHGVNYTTQAAFAGSSGVSSQFIIWVSSLSLFVAGDLAASTIATSPDGITWTLRASAARGVRSVAFDGTRLVTAGDSGQMSSLDGITWTNGSSTATHWLAVSPELGVVAYCALNGSTSLFTSADHGATLTTYTNVVPASTTFRMFQWVPSFGAFFFVQTGASANVCNGYLWRGDATTMAGGVANALAAGSGTSGGGGNAIYGVYYYVDFRRASVALNTGTNGVWTSLAYTTEATGTGSPVYSISPSLTTPNLGTPSALTLTNATGLPVAGLSNLGAGVATYLVTPTSANLAATVTVTGTGSFVLATSPSLTTPTLGVATATSLAFSPTTSGIIGTATNDSASAGIVGELIDSDNTVGVALSNGTGATITSINLTAGDWDVWGSIQIAPAGTLTSVKGGINTTAATIPIGTGRGALFSGVWTYSTASQTLPVGKRTYSFAVTTTVYLVAQANFTVGCNGFGYIGGRRVR